MLSADARARLTVVLVGARNPQNIGAAARAMQDFGFRDLRVVNEFAPPFEAAQLEAKSAVAADDIMRSARLFGKLSEAIADCTVVAGTTAIGGRQLDQPVRPLREAVAHLLPILAADAEQTSTGQALSPVARTATHDLAHTRVALLFGSEKTGLTREQLSFCSLLLTIPMYAPEGRHLSMNLGQSVAVCLYEFSRGGFEGERALPILATTAATVDDRERLLGMVRETLRLSGYSRRFPANAREAVLRQLLLPLASSRDEAATWMGIFRQLLRTLSGGSVQGE